MRQKTSRADRIFTAVVFLLFFAALLWMHRFLWPGHDDYGYASLSYVGPDPGSRGMTYGLGDIFDFLSIHYMSWGGRVLWFFLEIVLFRTGLWAYRLFSAVAILLMAAAIFRIAERSCEKSVPSAGRHLSLIALASCAGLGMLETPFFKDTVFWPTAGVLYFFPFLPLYAFILFYRRDGGIARKLLCAVLIFVSAWSQEQVSVIAVGFICLFTLVGWIRDRKMHRSDLIPCAAALAGFLILMLAPGNAARIRMNEDFYALSLPGKIQYTVPRILAGLFCNVSRFPTITLLLTALFCEIRNEKEGAGPKVLVFLNRAALLDTAIALAVSAWRNDGWYIYFVNYWPSAHWKLFANVVSVLFLLLLGGAMALFFFRRGEIRLFCFLLAAAAGQACMVVSPVYVERTAVPFITALMVFAVRVLAELCAEAPTTGAALTAGYAAVAALSLFSTIYGCQVNNDVQIHNDAVLREAAAEAREGTDPGQITLWKIRLPDFAEPQGYEDGYGYINYYKRCYYGLPQGSEYSFVYIDAP